MRPFIFFIAGREGRGELLGKMRELSWGYLCALALKIDKMTEKFRKREEVIRP